MGGCAACVRVVAECVVRGVEQCVRVCSGGGVGGGRERCPNVTLVILREHGAM